MRYFEFLMIGSYGGGDSAFTVGQQWLCGYLRPILLSSKTVHVQTETNTPLTDSLVRPEMHTLIISKKLNNTSKLNKRVHLWPNQTVCERSIGLCLGKYGFKRQ